MAHVIRHFTEQELRDLQDAAKATDSDIRIDRRRFTVLAHAYLAHETILGQLKESGIDTSYPGGTPHAVSRLIGEHTAMQRMAEGAGIVPAPLFKEVQAKLMEMEILLERWRTWAFNRLHPDESGSPRRIDDHALDKVLRDQLEERLKSG